MQVKIIDNFEYSHIFEKVFKDFKSKYISCIETSLYDEQCRYSHMDGFNVEIRNSEEQLMWGFTISGYPSCCGAAVLHEFELDDMNIQTFKAIINRTIQFLEFINIGFVTLILLDHKWYKPYIDALKDLKFKSRKFINPKSGNELVELTKTI